MKGKPSLKKSILKYQLPGQVILRFNGKSGQIEDPKGVVWTLVHLLDGKHTYTEIINKLSHQYPSISPTTIAGHIQELQEHHLLEDVSYKVTDFLDAYTADR